MVVDFYDIGTIDNEKLEYAVICCIYKGKFVFVRHKERETWEIPGGRREIGEVIEETGKRELEEETGAKQFSIHKVCDYSVSREEKTSYGRLFYSEIEVFGDLPNMEIEEVRLFNEMPTNLTYPEIQPLIHRKVIELKANRKW
ncbi:NUDIX domain-containing protein [Clostridium sp. D2Q-11]|uniref:NUDIX domain-containing protein n=1 Tax=Anaeromonas frigoriresistens TaxID=2683708 RepID=A0A942UTJ7_9FIRM|nr:NUDIX domain-containing protein [Anaeromonas frigoriresistens]MBS4537720.1 NUDIX domain-containing protein [Anaeromonas frigoriresistens]